jgi:hypothetical protein
MLAFFLALLSDGQLLRGSFSSVIASEAKQSIAPPEERMDCFVAALPLRKRFAFVAGQ